MLFSTLRIAILPLLLGNTLAARSIIARQDGNAPISDENNPVLIAETSGPIFITGQQKPNCEPSPDAATLWTDWTWSVDANTQGAQCFSLIPPPNIPDGPAGYFKLWGMNSVKVGDLPQGNIPVGCRQASCGAGYDNCNNQMELCLIGIAVFLSQNLLCSGARQTSESEEVGVKLRSLHGVLRVDVHKLDHGRPPNLDYAPLYLLHLIGQR
ncbi:hypothetical protein BGZ63DRAFT_445756 [Mariannaea sp. PMI_226]|nr:hypothetical protein BGZ63DRAFT_445756 [Mariannaea sp. PMI_226]